MKTRYLLSSVLVLASAIASLTHLTATAQSRPDLAISVTTNHATLTWSTNYPDYTLESTGALSGTWTDVADATNGTVTLPMVSSNQFFRLKETVSVTYILNEGFLISGRDKKVLIDGIFSRAVWDFYGLGGDVLNQQTNALPPFTNINVMLFSHTHTDHLDSRFAFQNMTNDPAPLVLGPLAVFNTMKSALGSRFPIVSNRVVTASPPNGSSTNVEVAGIDFKVVGLTQSDDPAFNTGFLFTLGGLRFLHVGDNYSTNMFDYTPLAGEQIDVAMINCFLFDTPPGSAGSHQLPQPRHDAGDASGGSD